MREKMALRKSILAAMFLAIGLILPFITMQIPAIGKMLCPMHIPVLLCGYICGWPYGLLIGFITPLFRGVLFGMPALFPNAVCMAFELATYGMITGILSAKMEKDIRSLYISLIRLCFADALSGELFQQLYMLLWGQDSPGSCS